MKLINGLLSKANKKEFSEYIAKGWHVYFIPPIIIQKDLGTIAELNIESPIIKKYLKQKR